MSTETLQFVELARQYLAQLSPVPRTYPLYCECCGRPTKHTCFERGDWEFYRCQCCGAEETYRVR